jgi:hypothetical protein
MSFVGESEAKVIIIVAKLICPKIPTVRKGTRFVGGCLEKGSAPKLSAGSTL